MINLKNITDEQRKDAKDRYFSSVNLCRHRKLREIMEGLTPDAELIGCNLVNVHDREKDSLIHKGTPQSYINYILNGYVVYVEFGNFWMFDGVLIHAHKLNDDGVSYFVRTYPEYYKIDLYLTLEDCEKTVGQMKEIIRLCNNPEELYAKQARINSRSRSDHEYCSRKRFVTIDIFTI